MPVEDYADYFSTVSCDKELDVQERQRRKITSDDHVTALQAEINQDIPTFENPMFSGDGGQVAAVLSQTGIAPSSLLIQKA